MNEQIERLCFHMRMAAFSLRRKIFLLPLEKPLDGSELTGLMKEEIRKLREQDESLQREREEYIRSEPILIPQNTMFFGGGKSKKKVNFWNAGHYRADIQKAYAWAISHGINVFVVDYSKPIGLLALETLLDLRCADESFRLYAVQTARARSTKSYRLIRETDIEIIQMLAKCDYFFHYLTIVEMFDKISSKVGYRYNEDGIQIDDTNLEGWNDE